MTTTTTPVTPFLEDFLKASMPAPLLSVEMIFNSGDLFGKKEMQISWLQAAFLQMLVKISNAKNILEVGTYVGFSASVFATSSPNIESVVTCEIVPEHHKQASLNMIQHGLADKVVTLLGDAKDLVLNNSLAHRKFDIFFLDGDKENYDHYLDVALSVLMPGGLFVIDNTLFKGELIGGSSSYSNGIRKLFEKMRCHPSFDMSHVTLGDGMLIARRR